MKRLYDQPEAKCHREPKAGGDLGTIEAGAVEGQDTLPSIGSLEANLSNKADKVRFVLLGDQLALRANVFGGDSGKGSFQRIDRNLPPEMVVLSTEDPKWASGLGSQVRAPSSNRNDLFDGERPGRTTLS